MFSTLSSLVALTATQSGSAITEAKSTSSDFEGIQSVVNDCLADLNDKVEALMKLAKASGATKLDTVKDPKTKMVTFEAINKLTTDYVKAMKSLMSEADAMIMQVAESQVDTSSRLLSEGATLDYSGSAEFTDEFHDLLAKVNDIKRIVKAPRWMDYMVTTDHNFETTPEEEEGEEGPQSCADIGKSVVMSVNELSAAITTLEKKIDSAV